MESRWALTGFEGAVFTLAAVVIVRQRFALRVHPKDDADLPRAIEEAYRLTLGRRPTDGERERMVSFVRAQVSAGAGAKALDTAMVDCCQVLLCLNEFVFVD